MDPLFIISCAAHAAKAAEHHGRHFFPMFSPNLFDVIITAIICVTVGVVVISALFTFYKWKKNERKAAESKNKGESEDPNAKQRAELQSQLLTFLEKSTSKEVYNEELDKIIKTTKEINSVESQYYISVLKALIDNKPIPAYPSTLQADEN